MAQPRQVPTLQHLWVSVTNTLQLRREAQMTSSTPAYDRFKRIFDVCLALCGLVAFSPLYIFVAVITRLTSAGPAIVHQERVGQMGKRFVMHKFRTMRKDALLYETSPRIRGDDRITGIGRILRMTSLDEMPQLWNIVKGDMSFVGPRPEMPFLVERYTPAERHRLDVLPGLTGLWQVSGRKDIPLHENLALDLYYVSHRSFLLDIRILLKTIIVVLSCKGAY
jgi:lipopolysaccharide/colanic/teichoic acid biosynthesis glycosyltransferase